jgi:hypothetical protein
MRPQGPSPDPWQVDFSGEEDRNFVLIVGGTVGVAVAACVKSSRRMDSPASHDISGKEFTLFPHRLTSRQ